MIKIDEKVLKFIRIFLLILILTGLALLATQKIWVPKLVEQIISSEEKPIIVEPLKNAIVSDKKNEVVNLKDGRQCYSYNHEATVDAPYTVNEFIDMTIVGDKVTGVKTGTQAGPDMTNGYEGTLTGTFDKNTINVVFSYTIEGSKNKEKEIYRANFTGIEKLRYPLIEQKDILVPDMTKEFSILKYSRVGCEGSN